MPPLLLSNLPHYKNILLLQGPMGPFFKKLAHYWKCRGAQVSKINFNPGDDFFYSKEAITYKGTLEEWPDFLSSF